MQLCVSCSISQWLLAVTKSKRKLVTPVHLLPKVLLLWAQCVHWHFTCKLSFFPLSKGFGLFNSLSLSLSFLTPSPSNSGCWGIWRCRMKSLLPLQEVCLTVYYVAKNSSFLHLSLSLSLLFLLIHTLPLPNGRWSLYYLSTCHVEQNELNCPVDLGSPLSFLSLTFLPLTQIELGFKVQLNTVRWVPS